MATRSMIGYKCGDGKIRASYCHWDGYIDGVGSTLQQSYNSEAQASQFASMRQMSKLDEFYFKCSFYEEPTETHIYDNEEAFVNCEEYNYLWKDGQWFVSCKDTQNKFVPLKNFFEREE